MNGLNATDPYSERKEGALFPMMGQPQVLEHDQAKKLIVEFLSKALKWGAFDG